MSVATLKIATPNDREIVMTRAFHASRDLVFDCFTRPERLKRWLNGPDGWQLVVCDQDFRVGGAYRWLWHGPGGMKMVLRGVHHEIVRPERIVRTELFDNQPDEVIGTLILTDEGDETTVTLKFVYESREARDRAIKSGVEKGVATNLDRLSEFLALMPDRERLRRSA